MLGFNDIIGHEEIIRHLKNAIQTEKVSHSYIFTGDPGSGKKLLNISDRHNVHREACDCERSEQ